MNMIHNILCNNSFPVKPQNPFSLTPKQHQTLPTPKHRWATFTYVGKETTYITNIFRHSDLRIAYRTNNTIHNHLIHKNQSRNKFCSSGVYKLTCSYCKKDYVGQTGRNVAVRYNEHKHTLRTNSHSSRLHNISKNTHIPSIPSTTPSRNITIKVLTSTHSNGFTFMLKAQPITT